MVLCCSLYMYVEWYAHECLLPVIHFLYMLCIWFHVWFWILKGSRNKFQLFLILTEGSDRVDFLLILAEVQLGVGAVQGVRRPSESSRLRTWEEHLETTAAGVHRVKRVSTLESVWKSAARSVCRDFLKGSELEKDKRGSMPSKWLKESVAMSDYRRTSFRVRWTVGIL